MSLENSIDDGMARGKDRYGSRENEAKKCPECGGALKSVGAGGYDCEKCGNNFGAEKWNGAPEDYKRKFDECIDLLAKIKYGLTDHKQRMVEDPQNYGYAGDLGACAENLKQALQRIG